MSDEETSDGILKTMERAEDSADEYVQSYCDLMTSERMGTDGWFDSTLHDLHAGINLSERRTFYSSPRSLDEISQPERTPENHPLRAIAWVLEQARSRSVVRIFCYMLTDLAAIDLLIHHGASKTIRIITQDSRKTRERLNEFFSLYGTVSKRAFLERVHVRLANLSGTPCASRNVQMHDTSVITERHTTFGSYNLTALGRVGNWESLTVVDTEQLHIDRFDSIWNDIEGREIETFYHEMDSPTRGPKRRRRT